MSVLIMWTLKIVLAVPKWICKTIYRVKPLRYASYGAAATIVAGFTFGVINTGGLGQTEESVHARHAQVQETAHLNEAEVILLTEGPVQTKGGQIVTCHQVVVRSRHATTPDPDISTCEPKAQWEQLKVGDTVTVNVSPAQ